MIVTQPASHASQRLLSLDFLRGLIMVLLVMSSTGLYDYLYDNTKGQPFNLFIQQFTHSLKILHLLLVLIHLIN